MKITLIGTGNVATSLRPALEGAGHEVVQSSGRKFAETGTLPPRTNIFIICVKDNAIPAVAKALAGTDKLVVHTAGSISLENIPAKRRGVLYPMQTFSKARPVDFSEVPVFIESDTDLELLEGLAKSISKKVYHLDSEGRKYLHLAAVFASNFTNHCYDLSATLLQEHGIPFEVMLPLIDETARKVHALSPREAQTGPAVRYDTSVIEKQEALLTGSKREIYRLMSQNIHEYHDKL